MLLYVILSLSHLLPPTQSPAIVFTLIVSTSSVTLLLSAAIYRLSPWHPLAKYPGSLVFKLTKLRTFYGSWRGNYYRDIKKMHDQYALSTMSDPRRERTAETAAASAIETALGASKPGKCVEMAGDDKRSVPTRTMGRTEHAHRRKLWNRGLGKEAMPSHARSAAAGVEQLLKQFDRAADEGRSIDVTTWMRFYGFDFMGKFAFGRDFGLVQAGKDESGVWSTVSNSVFAADLIAHMHWLGTTGTLIPGLSQHYRRMRHFAKKCVQERLQRPATSLDLWYYLGKEGEEGRDRLSAEILAFEGILAIVAGSDTTATAMACGMYHLINNPDCLAKAREEIDRVVEAGQTPWLDADCHDSLPYLASCMNETLRLTPIVPTNGSRGVPAGSGGKVIAGHFIPENTEVFVSPYLLHHDPRYFSPETESFRPERWLDEPGSESKWNTNRGAFIPFSMGPAQCVGKNLARIEWVMVVSAILRHYQVKFAPGCDAKGWLEHIEEHLVIEVPELPVVLKRRAL
ncbi:cytochrome P450 [Auricularia subglabra TFB-10046 SS5]|nr:cytochrome P450 [Auricularia subglabra TFB-10046 SS5]